MITGLFFSGLFKRLTIRPGNYGLIVAAIGIYAVCVFLLS